MNVYRLEAPLSKDTKIMVRKQIDKNSLKACNNQFILELFSIKDGICSFGHAIFYKGYFLRIL